MRHVRVPVSQDVGHRFTARWVEQRRGTSRTGARFGSQWGQSHSLSGSVSAKVLSARHDGTRLAHASCRLTRVMEWELGSRRSDSAECRRKPMHGAGSCRLAFGPEQGGACENDKGRERSAYAEHRSSSCTRRGVARGVRTGAKSSTVSERPLHDVPRHGASVRTVGRSGRALRRVT